MKKPEKKKEKEGFFSGKNLLRQNRNPEEETRVSSEFK